MLVMKAERKHTHESHTDKYHSLERSYGTVHRSIRLPKTADMAKRMLDFGVHAPTCYFPLIVQEAMMIEPTETETRETLDKFVEIMSQIDREVDENPDILRNAPQNTPVKRLDERKAAMGLDVVCMPI